MEEIENVVHTYVVTTIEYCHYRDLYGLWWGVSPIQKPVKINGWGYNTSTKGLMITFCSCTYSECLNIYHSKNKLTTEWVPWLHTS